MRPQKWDGNPFLGRMIPLKHDGVAMAFMETLSLASLPNDLDALKTMVIGKAQIIKNR